MSVYSDYAKQYGVSIATAIRDRDWPLDSMQCQQTFVKETGRQPTETEMQEMAPNSPETIAEYDEDVRLQDPAADSIQHCFTVGRSREAGHIYYRDYNPVINAFFAFSTEVNRDVAESLSPPVFSLI